MIKNNNYFKKRKVTLIGTAINLALTIIKYTIGVITGSSALISDATHSVSDYVSDLVIIIGLKLSSKPPDKNHPYGHGKFETFASMLVGVTLILTGMYLVYEGINVIANITYGGTFVQNSYYLAFIAATLSVGIKEWLYFYTMHYAKKFNSSALKANAYHHRSDSYSSIGVLIGITFTVIHPSLSFMDPLSAIVVAVFIMHMGFKVLKPTFMALVESSASEELLNNIKNIASNTVGVLEIDKVRTRYIGSESMVDMEIRVNPALSIDQAHAISETVKDNIYNSINHIREIIIHVEPAKNTSKTNPLEADIINAIRRYISKIKEVDCINNIRIHYVHGGIEINLDIAVNPYISVKQGHDIADLLEKGLTNIDGISIVHVHLEFKKNNTI